MRSGLLLLLACMVLVSVDVHAQSFGSKLKDKVTNKMKQKGDQKLDQAVDSAIDKPVDKTEQKVKESVKNSGDNENGNEMNGQGGQPSEAQMQQYMQMFGGSGAVSIEDYPDLDEIEPSSFNGSFDMDMETWKNGKQKDDGTISWYIRDYDVAIRPEIESDGKRQSARMIIQRKKGIMIMLNEDSDEKTGMVMKMKTLSVDLTETESAEQLENMNVEVDRNTRKNINGYDCYKVRTWDETFESISWVTEDLDLDMRQLFSFLSIQPGGKNPYEEKFSHIRGMVIESTSTDKKTGEKDILTLNNIVKGSPDGTMFSTEGYDLMQMPDIGAFGQQ
jgi:hypothetical protein